MQKIYSQFQMDGLPISCTPYGSGHINRTYLLVTSRPHLYILQGLNTSVFKDIPGLMNNVAAVTDHLRKKTADPRRIEHLSGLKCHLAQLHRAAQLPHPLPRPQQVRTRCCRSRPAGLRTTCL